MRIKLIGTSELARDVAIEVCEHGGYVTVVPIDGLPNDHTSSCAGEDMYSFWARQQEESLNIYGDRFQISSSYGENKLHISELNGSVMRNTETYWQSLAAPRYCTF